MGVYACVISQFGLKQSSQSEPPYKFLQTQCVWVFASKKCKFSKQSVETQNESAKHKSTLNGMHAPPPRTTIHFTSISTSEIKKNWYDVRSFAYTEMTQIFHIIENHTHRDTHTNTHTHTHTHTPAGSCCARLQSWWPHRPLRPCPRPSWER